MNRRRWISLIGLCVAGLGASFLIAVSAEKPPDPPDIFTITSGATRLVAGGRAQIWIDDVSSVYSAELKRDVVSVTFEVRCGGEIHKAVSITNSTSAEFCDCRVRLLDALATSPPTVKLEVAWQGIDPPLGIQAASSAAPIPPFAHDGH